MVSEGLMLIAHTRVALSKLPLRPYMPFNHASPEHVLPKVVRYIRYNYETPNSVAVKQGEVISYQLTRYRGLWRGSKRKIPLHVNGWLRQYEVVDCTYF